MRRASLTAGAAALLWAGSATGVRAHDGPPFPIVEDRAAGAYSVSVWTDPDATDDGSPGGQFWVIVHGADGSAPPAGTQVAVAARPHARKGEVRSPAARSPRDAAQWSGAVVMDHEGRWDVQVDVAGPLGPARVAAEVDATYDLRPPPLMLLVYALPFVAVAGLWLKAVRGRRRYGPARRGPAGPLALVVCAAVFGEGCSSCRRELKVPEATYEETVAAFHTALAAMQTSQEPLARRELERVTRLVPEEPAGWANLGLLSLRQQDLEAAGAALTRAADLAPKDAAVQRLLALLESARGRLPEAVAHWRRAADLDPRDLRAPFHLAMDLERQGGPEAEAQAREALASLLERSENLAARLELARLAAKAGDAAALERAIAPLRARAPSWPGQVREMFAALEAASADPRSAAPRVAFLKNVLLRVPEYRHARAAVTTPRAEVGEPLARFLRLPNPEPRPAAADDRLAFTAEAMGEGGTSVVAAAWPRGEGAPVLVTAGTNGARLPDGSLVAFPSVAVVAADFDHDYRGDVLLAGPQGLKLLLQTESGAYSDVTGATALPAATLRTDVHRAWAADVDTEGDLDVVLGVAEGPPVVLRNNADGTFAEQRPFEGVSRVRGFVWADLDGDGVPDAVLLDADGRAHVFVNLRGGVFRRAAEPAGAPPLAAVAAAEVTGDALLDVIGVSRAGSLVRLSLAPDAEAWTAESIGEAGALPSLSPAAARLLVADLDNNGAADLVFSGEAASTVLLGSGGAAFRPLGTGPDAAVHGVADLDGDGRLELLGVDGAGRAVVVRTRGARQYHWQVLRPRSATATGDQRINSFGLGGEVELRAGLHFQKALIGAPSVHFGLGEAAQADVVRIVWPNGAVQSEFEARADAVVPATQRLKGSCPWLFAWNGREMAFVTDLIWRSPLGLRINAQATADVLMTQDWVKVRGDQLAARDGAYDLRVTAELWETHFFDLLSLLVVDHPEGTEVFVDERFAVPPPALQVVATGPVQPLLAARDDLGRDAAEVLGARDGRHLDFAGRGPYQGITRPHFVELELPEEAPRRGPLWLVAQGWVHPTDSSINVAISHGAHARPEGLSLHVADAGGRFTEVRRGLGFPAGKDKTVLLDLSGLLPPAGPRRVRLATNLEVFWDRIGWAAGRPDVRVTPRRLALASAELRARGYSVTEQRDAGSPERPRYVLAGTAPRWLDLEGYHTRFGPVEELLEAVDDRYVIMTSGDELRLRFPEAPPAAPGLVRDFVVVGDGWVKDGDYNTTFSRTVLPLPTHASARYADPPGALEDDPVYRRHRRDFDQYHTRYVAPEAVRGALLARPGVRAER